MIRHTMIGAVLALIGSAMIAGCTSTVRDVTGRDSPADLQAERSDLRDMAAKTLMDLDHLQPGAKRAAERAAGYAVFSDFSTKLGLAGGGSGKGLAVDNATGKEVFMGMLQVQAGLGFGIRKFRAVWVFATPAAFEGFVTKGYEFGGQATAAAQAGSKGTGYSGAVSVSPGVWVYQMTTDGLAAELSLQGTRYYRDTDLNH